MLKRGFKAQCERRSLETRRTLGLADVSPLEAASLAAHLGVTIWSASNIRDLAASDLDHLLNDASSEWSAFVIRERGRFLVVFNPRLSAQRTNSVLMHELSHVMLGHELSRAERTEDGHFLNGSYDEVQEAEADWLGGALLLPRPALLWIRGRRMTDVDAAEHFGVSLDMLQWRVRMTGVNYQFARAG